MSFAQENSLQVFLISVSVGKIKNMYFRQSYIGIELTDIFRQSYVLTGGVRQSYGLPDRFSQS